MKQSLESTLRCATAQHPASWSLWLAWADYAHNFLVLAATGVSPFMAALGYQPPLFQEQEEEVAVPSVRVSDGAGSSGNSYMRLWCAPPSRRSSRQTAARGRLQHTVRENIKCDHLYCF